MKSKIRQHLINGFGQKVTKIKTFSGEPFTDCVDCNGKEIFVGDVI